MLYPAKFEKEESGLYAVSFRDIPEAITCGDDYDDAVKMAKDALLTCMDFYFEDHRRVPHLHRSGGRGRDGNSLL